MTKINPFDPNAHEEMKSFDPLPPGWYPMQIITAEVCKTKSGDGSYVKLEWEIVESMRPDLKGRRVWENLNLWNSNPDAVDIANRMLASICKAVGLGQIDDTDLLLARPMAVKVKIRPAEGQYEAQNSCTGFDAIAKRFAHGSPVPAQQTATMPPPSGATAAVPPPASAVPPASSGPGVQPAPGAAPWGPQTQ